MAQINGSHLSGRLNVKVKAAQQDTKSGLSVGFTLFQGVATVAGAAGVTVTGVAPGPPGPPPVRPLTEKL